MVLPPRRAGRAAPRTEVKKKATADSVASGQASEPAALQPYRAKRDFGATPEPAGAAPADHAGAAPADQPAADTAMLAYVVQKHWASRLHYDFRLQWRGVMLSWALPKGLSLDAADKRIAVQVEAHPLAYNQFEGTIPKGQYGAGRVIVWDRGHWLPVGDADAGLAAGKLVFDLHGQKLAGRWELVRIAKPGDRSQAWMLFKKRDAWARALADYDVLTALPDSVVARPLGPLTARARPAAAPAASPAASPAAPHAASPPPLLRAADLPGARRGALPATLSPQLAQATDTLPAAGDWRCELKFDGYRLLTRVDGRGAVALFTRNGNDWTARLQPLAAALARRRWRNTWLDGEIVVLGAAGTPDFNALQKAVDSDRAETIRWFLFDLPFHDGVDLRGAPLSARRALLRQLLAADAAADDPADPVLRFSADFDADPASLLASARALGIEGLIAKRADAPYVSRRSASWLKLKIAARQELVVGGFTERQGAHGQVGSLILGLHDDDGALHHAGSVGTGWDAATAVALHARLLPLLRATPPFAAGSRDPGRWSRRGAGNERWVEPRLLVQVRFAGWTPDGHVRHAVYQGLRDDRPALDVRREPLLGDSAAQRVDAAVQLSHPQRVIDASTGLTKRDLFRYYDSMAERMLPHLAGRPLSLLRAPEGVGGPQFFQKHDEAGSLPGLRVLDAALWPGHAPLLALADAQGLLSAVQMNVIEFHTWNATVGHIGQPDRIVFDLDPGAGVAFAQVREAALLTRTLLDELGLLAWLKTSGGKGLHVVVPIVPLLGADAVKAFSRAAVQHLAGTLPQRFVAKSGPANRVGKVFVDFLRNGHGATTVAAYSARARPGLGVSMPLPWDALAGLKSAAQWTIANARDHVSLEAADPWQGAAAARQTLDAALARLGLAAPVLAMPRKAG